VGEADFQNFKRSKPGERLQGEEAEQALSLTLRDAGIVATV